MIMRLFPAALVVLVARWSRPAAAAAGGPLAADHPRGRRRRAVPGELAAGRGLGGLLRPHNTASVVQHFWSLSIQGQFYLVWPLLVALVALVAARRGWTVLRAHLTVALLGVFAASLAYSVSLTAANQPLAYFHSLTRLWEFALGGLLALGIDRGRAAAPAALVARLGGVVGLRGLRHRAAGRQRVPRLSRRCGRRSAPRWCSLAGHTGSRWAPTGCSARGRCATSATSASRCTCGTGRCWCCTWWRATGRRRPASAARS